MKFLLLIVLQALIPVMASELTTLQNLSGFKYKGAFLILPDNSKFKDTEGRNIDLEFDGPGIFDYNPENNSIFLFSKGYIGEFAVPQWIDSDDITDINKTTDALQDWSHVFTQNPATTKKRVPTGLKVINNKIIINTAIVYDANADDTATTYILTDKKDLQNSYQSELLELQGAVHAGGWITDVPIYFENELGDNSLIFGYASNLSINNRSSMGPSAFVVSKDELNDNDISIPSTKLMDFNVANPMYKKSLFPDGVFSSWSGEFSNGGYGYNTTVVIKDPDTGIGEAEKDENGDVITIGNNLWTEKSKANFGFIVPGSDTYAVFGSSGGHSGSMGYKITQDQNTKNSNSKPFTCPGPCTYDFRDNYNYFWFFKVDDLIKVKNGELDASDVRPYQYGKFDVPFQKHPFTGEYEFHEIGGGAFDPKSNILYLSLLGGGQYSNFNAPPIFLAFEVSAPFPPKPPSNITVSEQ